MAENTMAGTHENVVSATFGKENKGKSQAPF
jgi:hypothetical protein